MNLSDFLNFLMAHNETIILLTLAGILILTGIFVYLNAFKGSSGTGEQTDFSQIEVSLKRILEQTNMAIARTEGSPAGTAGGDAAAGAAGVAVGGGGASSVEIEALKKELEVRKTTIEALQKEVKTAQGDEGSKELLAKIRDLEGKLAEYEIIEDDIADLSLYKEENAKLKRELDVLRKRGGPELVDAFASALNKEQPGAPADDITVVSAASAVSAGASSAEVIPAGPVKTPATSEDDLLAAVAEAQDQLISPDASPAAAGKSKDDPQDDIFAEFSGESEGQDPMAALGNIDTNKMLAELQGLEGDINDADALNASSDLDKMAEEAKGLGKGE